MGDHYFAFPPEIYLYKEAVECVLLFMSNIDDTWVLGNSFLRSYYSVWDHENNRLGLSPHKTSEVDVVTVADVPLPKKTFQETTVVDIALEVVKIAALGVSAATAVGTMIFLADVIFTNMFKA